jgi:hypothetical protein
MNSILKNCLRCFAILLLIQCSPKPKEEWTNLLDKDLTQWETYLSYAHKNGYNGSVPVDSLGHEIQPIGYNHDSTSVFRAINVDDDIHLRVSGEIYGCLYTKQEFENYHLTLEVKWGEKTFEPRTNRLKDSGLLYHSIGAAGVDYWRSWMLSQEFQIMEGHMGDYWNIANAAIDIRAFPSEDMMNGVANTNQPFIPYGTGAPAGVCLRSNNYDRDGEWTKIELIAFEDKSLHIVNGHVVMVLQNSRYIKDGDSYPLVKGKIQLQSEAAEVYYKNIRIKSIESMPTQYAQYY